MMDVNHSGFEYQGDGIWKNRMTHVPKSTKAVPCTLEQVTNGHLIPIVSDRKRFAEEIYDILKEIVLKNEMQLPVQSDDGVINFSLPPKEQLWDFLSIQQADTMQDIAVTICYPDRSTAMSPNARYWIQEVVYTFPTPYQLIQKE